MLYDSAGEEYATATLQADGSITFEDIPDGTYYLAEYVSDGWIYSYDKTTGTVDDTATIVADGTYNGDTVRYLIVTVSENSNDTIEVKITNALEYTGTEYDLPESGGLGNIPYFVLSLVSVLAGIEAIRKRQTNPAK